jgi:hypothetical protein
MNDVEVGALIRDTMRLMVRNGWRIALAMALLTAIAVFADVSVEQDNRGPLDLLVAAATLFLQTWLTIGSLADHDHRRSNKGVGAVLGIGILSGLGIVIGLVLLVLPGIFLAVRWAAAVPFALGDDASVTEALQASYDETRDAFWPILGGLLLCYLPIAVGAGLAYGPMASLDFEGALIASSITINVLINVSLFAGWHLAIAIFLARRRESELSATFA